MMKKIIVFFAVFLAGWLAQASCAQAASLYFSPNSGTKYVGQTFSVSVYVNSSEAMNAADGVVAFTASKLDVVSLDKGSSIFNLWMPEPSYNNSAGTVSFSGIVFNPGYTGTSGRLITINFRPTAEGTATLSFSSGAVYANDGEGTNITGGLGSASFTIETPIAPPPPPPPPPPVPQAPGAPNISSPTHPSQSGWFSNSNPVFNWGMGSMTGVSFSFDENASTDPGTVSAGTMSTQSYSTVAEGVHYFHARLQNTVGWGPVGHYKIQVDTEKPEYFNVTMLGSSPTNPNRIQFRFDSFDKTSGVDHYEIKVDDNDPVSWVDPGSHIYTTPTICPGDHTLIMKSVDKAGNFLDKTETFTIAGCAGTGLTGGGGGTYTVTTTEIRYATTTVIQYVLPASPEDQAKGIDHYLMTATTTKPYNPAKTLSVTTTFCVPNFAEAPACVKGELMPKSLSDWLNFFKKHWGLSLALLAAIIALIVLGSLSGFIIAKLRKFIRWIKEHRHK